LHACVWFHVNQLALFTSHLLVYAKGELTYQSCMHAYQDLCMQLCILSSLFYFQVFLLTNVVEPRCPSHSVHTSLLTLFNLPPAKSRIVVVVYIMAGRMITNLVEILYTMWSLTSSHRSTTLASAPTRSSKVGASYISNQMVISSTMDQAMLGVTAIYRHNLRSWIMPEVEELSQHAWPLSYATALNPRQNFEVAPS
jgi:hypothetical protein